MLQHDLERCLNWVYHQLTGVPCDTNMRDTKEDYAEAVKIALDKIKSEKSESKTKEVYVGVDYGNQVPVHYDAIFGRCPQCDYRYKHTHIADGEPCIKCGHPVISHLRSAKQLGVAFPASNNTANSGRGEGVYVNTVETKDLPRIEPVEWEMVTFIPLQEESQNSGYLVEVDNSSKNGYTYITVRCAFCNQVVRSEVVEPNQENYQFGIPKCLE